MEDGLALFTNKPTVTSAWPKWPIVSAKDKQEIETILEKSKLSLLKQEGVVADFENAFSEKFGMRYALSFSSGTASIHSACFACGVGPGAEVLTPSYTWMSAITAILHGNGTPVFCDVKENTFYIDPDEILRKATPRTKAVIVCHTWGVPAPMDEIMEAAAKTGIKVIEDTSHCHGGKYKGRLLGTIGDIGCFSLQASKALPAGEGGVLVTDDQLLYERAMIPGHHDMRLKQCLTLPETKRFENAGAYWKYRASPLEMAFALGQLSHLDERNAVKAENFKKLKSQLKSISFLQFPEIEPDSTLGYYCVPCLYNYDQKLVARDLFVKALEAEGAVVFAGYNQNWYQSPILQDMDLFRQFWVDSYPNGTCYNPMKKGSLPNTDDVVNRGIVFPLWGVPVTELVYQYAEAFKKVSERMDELAIYQQIQD